MKTLTSEAIVRFISSQQMLQSFALKEILMLKPSTPKQNTENSCDPAAGKKRGTSALSQSSEGSNLRVQGVLSTAVASNRPTEALASVISFTFDV